MSLASASLASSQPSAATPNNPKTITTLADQLGPLCAQLDGLLAAIERTPGDPRIDATYDELSSQRHVIQADILRTDPDTLREAAIMATMLAERATVCDEPDAVAQRGAATLVRYLARSSGAAAGGFAKDWANGWYEGLVCGPQGERGH